MVLSNHHVYTGALEEVFMLRHGILCQRHPNNIPVNQTQHGSDWLTNTIVSGACSRAQRQKYDEKFTPRWHLVVPDSLT
jgi:hypothetical protein